MKRYISGISFLAILCFSCKNSGSENKATNVLVDSIVKPVIVTDTVQFDTDDPAIWINKGNPGESLILGTDKETEGALYVYDLKGKIVPGKKIEHLQRPNNVDVEYGLMLNGVPVDIAVVTERLTHKLRIFSVPDMKPVDNGGIEIFMGQKGEGFRDLMGISLYKNPEGKIYAIAGRKNGPKEDGYLWQYLLEDNGKGVVRATLVRKFGKFSGLKEIESIAVDDKMGFVYYSDEGFGVRQYFADINRGNNELSVFGKNEFAGDHEGISFYETSDSTGYIVVSDQQRNHFRIYRRESKGNNYDHEFLKSVHLSTLESDGSEMVSIPLNETFKKGLFVAMSTDKTFHYYRWEDIWK